MKTQTKQKPIAISKKIAAPLATPTTILPVSRTELASPYDPQKDEILIELLVNPAKIDVMQPDLVAACKIGEIEISVAAWQTKTRDGQRMYYSASLNDEVRRKEAWKAGEKKIEPLHRVKLYEFRKSCPSDPDFASTEPFIEAGQPYWSSMWVLLPADPEDIDNIRYFLLFSPKRFRQALSETSREQVALGVARLLQRRKELEEQSYYTAQQARQRALTDEDEIL